MPTLKTIAHCLAANIAVNCLIKIKENKAAAARGIPAYDIYVKQYGAARGRLLFCVRMDLTS